VSSVLYNPPHFSELRGQIALQSVPEQVQFLQILERAQFRRNHTQFSNLWYGTGFDSIRHGMYHL